MNQKLQHHSYFILFVLSQNLLQTKRNNKKRNKTNFLLIMAPRRSTRIKAVKQADELNQIKTAKVKATKTTKRSATRKRKIANEPSSCSPAKKKTKASSAATKKKTASTTTKKTNASPSPPKVTAQPPVDDDLLHSHWMGVDFSVVKNSDGQWYDVVLNQCNITGSSNNNKYYRLQLLQKGGSNGSYYVWFKWGRVGEPSTGKDLKGPFATEEAALKVFAKKYKDKTQNTWGNDEFVPKKGKYTRIEIDYEVESNSKPSTVSGTKKDNDVEYLESQLDPKTRELVEELFSEETRDNALTSFNLDLKKLPLGVPSQQQIQNGVSILNEIEDKLNGGNVSNSYAELSSQFYTAIPHSFGRKRPPAISTQASLQERYDMCNILTDMFSTNETLRQVAATKVKKQVPYPADSQYETLKADLSHIDKKSKQYKLVNKYFEETKGSSSSSKLLDVWSVDREGESKRHKGFSELDNRRLLWHGTNIAVAAPIITSGLRIMPHSGGRVGSGIYLASMQEKSAQYTSAYGAKFACMFLCEGALGKSHTVTSDGYHASSLKKAPSGFDSVHAVGSITPKSWTATKLDGKSVQVPNTKAHDSGVSSSFYHDEFLVYDEAQVRLRYIVTVAL
jgi:poly [ADP-ribose] polymerase